MTLTVPPEGGCSPCRRGEHARCWRATSDAPADACPCHDADPDGHTALEPWRVLLDEAMGGPDSAEFW